MKKLNNILLDITRLTSNIENNYPELYRNLDENPMTIPTDDNPAIDVKIMQEYLDSLKQLLKHYIENKNIK